MNKPLVSIALCTYNGEQFLVEQLDSIVNQTYPNLEVIIVDDGSKDETISILQSYSKKHTNIKIYQNEVNLGYIKNFEKAITLCSGEYIALSDQDDIWILNKIELQVEEIGNNILIYHDSEFVNQQGASLNKKMSDILKMYEGESYRPFLFFNCLSGHECLFHKSLIAASIPFPKEIFHDRWLAFTATNRGSIKYLDVPLVKYRQHEKSDTNILKLKRSKSEKTIQGNKRIEKTISELEIFFNYAHTQEREFIEGLLKLYRIRLTSYFCFSLVFFLFMHYKSLLYISKKGTLSKLNFIIKHLWGAKFKKS